VKQFNLLGTPDLAALYAQAAAALGIETRTLDPNCATRALFRLGAMLR